jgi:hypothetical protein
MAAIWKSDNQRLCFGRATIDGRAFVINDALPAIHAMVVSRRHTAVIFALENVPFERGVSL